MSNNIVTIGFKHKAVQKALKDIDRNLKSIDKLRKEYTVGVSALVYQDVMEHFELEQGPIKRWPEWSDAYTRHMRKQGKGANFILQDTGNLRNNFKKTDYRRTTQGLLWYNDAMTKPPKQKLKKGTVKVKQVGAKKKKAFKPWPYAAMHNYGLANEHGVKVPERRFMWLSDRALERVAEVTAEFTLRGL